MQSDYVLSDPDGVLDVYKRKSDEKPQLSVRLRGNLVLCQETLLEPASGLVVPENLSEQTKKSIACHRIVALGPDAVHKGLSLGQRVLIRPGCPVYKLPDDSKRFAVHEDDILGTVDEPAPQPEDGASSFLAGL